MTFNHCGRELRVGPLIQRCFNSNATHYSPTTCSCWVRAWMLNCQTWFGGIMDTEHRFKLPAGFQLQGESVPSIPHCFRFNYAPRFRITIRLCFSLYSNPRDKLWNQRLSNYNLQVKSSLHTYVFMFYTLRMVLHIFKWSKNKVFHDHMKMIWNPNFSPKSKIILELSQAHSFT